MVPAGLVCWGLIRLRHGSGGRIDAYLLGLAAWLAIQAWIVAYEFKQYYAPWFLLASIYAVFLGQVVSELPRRLGPLLFVFVCATAGLWDLAAARDLLAIGEATSQRSLIRWMNEVTFPEDPVVASPPLHPIDRVDSFFLWFNTVDSTGFDAERVLERMPAFHDRNSARHFREELEQRPPALVVLSGGWRIVPYTPGQQEALTGFLQNYHYLPVSRGAAWFSLRPDRFEQARTAGLLDAYVGYKPGPDG
jgi:hypothetical protein